MELKYYKPGQGTWARWTAGILLGLFVLFGAHSLYNFPGMEKLDDQGRVVGRTFWGTQLVEHLPGIKQGLTVGLIVSSIVFVAGLLGIYLAVVNNRRVAEFLIETESEMHRVSWPPRHQYVGSSIVVVISVIVIGSFVAAADLIIQFLLTKTGFL